MQLGHMEASGKFGTAAMAKHSEQMQTNSSNTNKKRRKAKAKAC
jgi:hypothetical protein